MFVIIGVGICTRLQPKKKRQEEYYENHPLCSFHTRITTKDPIKHIVIKERAIIESNLQAIANSDVCGIFLILINDVSRGVMP